MSKTSTVVRRIVGGVIGLLAGGVSLGLVGGLLAMLLAPDSHGDPDSRAGQEALFIFVGLVGLGVLIGTIVGSAAGATITQKLSRQRSSFWRALLATFVGLTIGGFLSYSVSFVLAILGRLGGLHGPLFYSGIPLITCSSMVAGAVIGSGWKGKPADAAATSPQRRVILPGDTLKPQPGQARCPFCASTTFRVEEEAGLRRCSDCHSVLPNHIQGNR